MASAFALAIVASGTEQLLAAQPPSSDTPTVGEAADSADPGQPEPGEPATAGAGDEAGPEPGDAASDPNAPNPFARRIKSPSLEGGIDWVNTKPIDLKDLRGKFVLLDFWTYCCINCMHILPELKKLEAMYPNDIVVIGVHSAKFETEKDSANIAEAVRRYDIEHPVINDSERMLWNKFEVNSWPSLRVIDPEGYIIAAHGGEITFADLEQFFKPAIAYYRGKGLLDEKPLKFDLQRDDVAATPLRFPGKVLADAESQRLFIADSNHNRIVVSSLDGKLQTVIGSGKEGKKDGSFAECSFHHPQGMALHGEQLYIADTENHAMRLADLASGQVRTIAGTGEQARGPWPGQVAAARPGAARFVGPPASTALNSPWSLWIHGDAIYIAMAGPHQIWKMPLDASEIGPYAGNGREDIVDGPLLPAEPYAVGAASFAQPSELTGDDKYLYVADSEGSSVRRVPFDPTAKVITIVGTAQLPAGRRLFTSGDIDGKGRDVRLQHLLGVAYAKDAIYLADTYNNKIKRLELDGRIVKTIAGDGKPGKGDDPAQFDEPAGLSIAGDKLYVADTNNHAVRVIDLAHENAVSTLAIEGLEPPVLTPVDAGADKPAAPPSPSLVILPPQRIKSVSNQITFAVNLDLPEGATINPDSTMKYRILVVGRGPIDGVEVGQPTRVDPPSGNFNIVLPVTEPNGDANLQVVLDYAYLPAGGSGLGKPRTITWRVQLKVDATASQATVRFNDRPQ